MTDEKMIAFGGTLKATQVDDNTGRIAGYLIYFTGPDEVDLHGEYFNAKTDLCIPVEQMNGLPFYYQHGLDATLDIKQISVLENVRLDEVGVWAEAQLDLHDEYKRAIFQLTQKGILGFSSGAWPQSVKTTEDGWIARWRVIEGSGTPTPAMPKRTVISAKSYVEMIKGDTGHEDHKAGAEADTQQHNKTSTSSTPNKGMKSMNEILQKVVDMLMGVINGADPMAPVEEPVVAAALQDEVAKLPDDEKNALEGAEDTEKKAIAVEKLFLRAAKARADAKIKQMDFLAKSYASAKQQMGAAPANLVGGLKLGAASPDSPNKAWADDSVTDLRFAHLTDLDMAVAYKLAIASTPLGAKGMAGRKPTDFVSEDFYKHAMHKAYDGFARKPLSRGHEHLEVKSAMPVKANELDASNITGQGAEWLGVYYDAQVWEKARNIYIYKMMQSRGMMEKPVPQGFTSAKVPVEGNDPTVYGGTEANSVGADGRPEMVYKITPFGTVEVDVVPGIFRAAVAYTRILEEDTLVNVAQQANYQISLAMEENIERVMLNGDTATAINTNINFINGTPTSTGLTKDAYLEFNGLLKSPLVTSTAYSLDAQGAFSIETYLNLLSKLPSAQAARTNRLMYVVDFWTRQATLKFPDLKTKDVAGEGATIFTGTIPALWDIPLYMTGFMSLANNAGKVPLTAGVSTGTLGRILLIDAFYWAFTYKRNITIEMERNPSSESDIIYASMRFSLTRRSASAAAAAYNVLV
jgi:hypothetical protein